MRVLRAVKDRLSGFGADAYRWTIITSAPKGEAGERWGDTWFARDVAAALRRQGQQVSVVPRSGANQPPRSHDDVVVVGVLWQTGTKSASCEPQPLCEAPQGAGSRSHMYSTP